MPVDDQLENYIITPVIAMNNINNQNITWEQYRDMVEKRMIVDVKPKKVKAKRKNHLPDWW